MRILVMGVSGSGKTTIGKALAAEFKYPFLDADDFHSKANLAKMSAGIALDDVDREPWLRTLNAELLSRSNVVLACSALKAKYRKTLGTGIDLKFVYLSVNPDVIRERFAERSDHFMNPNLIESQFAALEAPKADEALCVKSDSAVGEIVGVVVRGLADSK